MLKEAKMNCKYLIVGLQRDPTMDLDYRVKTGGKNKNKPVQSYEERYLQVEACKYVDEIIPYTTESDLRELLQKINPDIRFLGNDWKGKEYTGYELGHKIHWCARDHGYSTSNLRKQVYEAELAE